MEGTANVKFYSKSQLDEKAVVDRVPIVCSKVGLKGKDSDGRLVDPTEMELELDSKKRGGLRLYWVHGETRLNINVGIDLDIIPNVCAIITTPADYVIPDDED
ncbi:hypothetical protein [Haloarchaeobius sp. HME9146]|uniref:hypothetical protein n=1 Tax=Haloarchaeobius sp. HME9146 TaxID=2978732 RepID=UPI0021BE73B2|nr:hypothetical protein [Haloarchaeobius sp. HME9146]MCT9095443.1 hypothetical protein [Haloarchaeobius sp. HME9146]